MNRYRLLLVAVLLAGGMGVIGPVSAQSSADVTPDITIRQEDDRTIREYRVNGELYAIEIQPAVGPSYYLVDHDGDGDFTRHQSERIAVPEWVLKRF
ncbi:DUF2782 domain-containing protein [Halomonas cerina]|uniref:DUF2782 domain-containing protein n=1 Tax=Halomonas cerina TaxID=447424 RepID=A0A839VF94_9GAMM|nr:DUF2782 domain-containing protein [Halomonas cerina]MBB3192029.1 hypothetical protein [Halomonas cerina]